MLYDERAYNAESSSLLRNGYSEGGRRLRRLCRLARARPLSPRERAEYEFVKHLLVITGGLVVLAVVDQER